MEMRFIAPAVTIASARQRLKVTARAAQQKLDQLTEEGMLKQVTGKRRHRMFAAKRILAIIEADARFRKKRNAGAGASQLPGVSSYAGGELN
jgi:hypothetical protein